MAPPSLLRFRPKLCCLYECVVAIFCVSTNIIHHRRLNLPTMKGVGWRLSFLLSTQIQCCRHGCVDESSVAIFPKNFFQVQKQATVTKGKICGIWRTRKQVHCCQFFDDVGLRLVINQSCGRLNLANMMGLRQWPPCLCFFDKNIFMIAWANALLPFSF